MDRRPKKHTLPYLYCNQNKLLMKFTLPVLHHKMKHKFMFIYYRVLEILFLILQKFSKRDTIIKNLLCDFISWNIYLSKNYIIEN